MLLAQADDLLNDNLKQDMCDVLGSVCLGAIMGNEVMFQYENSKFFDLCGVGGANNIIWNNVISDKTNGSDEDGTHLSPICAAVTTCHRVHFGHLLKVFYLIITLARFCPFISPHILMPCSSMGLKRFWSSTNHFEQVHFVLVGFKSFWTGLNYKNSSRKV